MNVSYTAIIQSSRVTEKTCAVLLERALPCDPGYIPKSVSPASFALLRAVLQRLIPQPKGEDFVDIAISLDIRRSEGSGDGWRYASMPPDHLALRLGLELMEIAAKNQYGVAFISMDQTKQDALLGQVQKGKNAGAWAELNARKWFEDLLAEAIEIYVSHPSTLSAMSFSGIAFLPEWPQIGLNTAQAWEPASDET